MERNNRKEGVGEQERIALLAKRAGRIIMVKKEDEQHNDRERQAIQEEGENGK